MTNVLEELAVKLEDLVAAQRAYDAEMKPRLTANPDCSLG